MSQMTLNFESEEIKPDEIEVPEIQSEKKEIKSKSKKKLKLIN